MQEPDQPAVGLAILAGSSGQHEAKEPRTSEIAKGLGNEIFFCTLGAIGLFFNVFELIDLHMRSEMASGRRPTLHRRADLDRRMIFFGLGAVLAAMRPEKRNASIPENQPQESGKSKGILAF